MSKFKSTLETENEISSGPYVFSQLETLANSLTNETLELEHEFNIKAEYVNKKFMEVYKNEREIENIFDMSLKLQKDFSKVEEKLKILETLFQQFERIAHYFEISSKMEEFCIKNICACGSCCRFCCGKTERQKFAELLEETNRKVERLPEIFEGMRELEVYGNLKSPYTDIISILNYHYEILKNTEKNLDTLVDKLPLIELQELSLKRQIKRNLNKNS